MPLSFLCVSAWAASSFLLGVEHHPMVWIHHGTFIHWPIEEHLSLLPSFENDEWSLQRPMCMFLCGYVFNQYGQRAKSASAESHAKSMCPLAGRCLGCRASSLWKKSWRVSLGRRPWAGGGPLLSPLPTSVWDDGAWSPGHCHRPVMGSCCRFNV